MKNKKRWLFLCSAVMILLIAGIVFQALNGDSSGNEDTYTAAKGWNTYTTKDASMPKLVIDYPGNWSVKSEEIQSNYEWVVFHNGRGIEINYASFDEGFGSTTYGGGYFLDSAHVTKVADASFVPDDDNGRSGFSSKKFVVAKIKVWAYEDTLTEEGEIEIDGPTYYAVVPESYLGDHYLQAPFAYWDLCSFEFVKPIAIIANAPGRSFSPDEEEEVIQILSSFRNE